METYPFLVFVLLKYSIPWRWSYYLSRSRHKKKQSDYLKNFDFVSETKVVASSINAKMNEIQVALWVLHLKQHNTNFEKRNLIAYHLKVK